MKTSESILFFRRFLLISTISVINVIICYLISSTSLFAAIITALLLMTNVFVLLFHLVIGITQFFKHTFDKNKKAYDPFYIVNMFMVLFVNAFFMVFYFTLLGTAMITIIA